MGWPASDERGEKAGKWGKIGRRVGSGRRGPLRRATLRW